MSSLKGTTLHLHWAQHVKEILRRNLFFELKDRRRNLHICKTASSTWPLYDIKKEESFFKCQGNIMRKLAQSALVIGQLFNK